MENKFEPPDETCPRIKVAKRCEDGINTVKEPLSTTRLNKNAQCYYWHFQCIGKCEMEKIYDGWKALPFSLNLSATAAL